jgi:alginate O-acetyltransferase complex protein AlgI
MVGFASGSGLEQHVGLHLNAMVAVALAAGVLGSTPLLPRLARWRGGIATMQVRALVEAGRLAGLVFLLVASAMLMAAGTYNPFIYFRF